jgi:hypothetical protein
VQLHNHIRRSLITPMFQGVKCFSSTSRNIISQAMKQLNVRLFLLGYWIYSNSSSIGLSPYNGEEEVILVALILVQILSWISIDYFVLRQ